MIATLALLYNVYGQFQSTPIIRQPIVINRPVISQHRANLNQSMSSGPSFSAPGIYGQFMGNQGTITGSTANRQQQPLIKLDSLVYQSAPTSNSASSGMGAGRASTQQVIIKLPGSQAATQLIGDSTDRMRFRTIDLYTVAKGAAGALNVTQKFELVNATISSFHMSTNANGNTKVSLTVTAQQIRISYPGNANNTNSIGGTTATDDWNAGTNP